MTPKDRVFTALAHKEPDRIPWGEHSIDYNVYEEILGRQTLTQAKIRETKAYWEGRRDEVVACVKRDRLDLVRALEMDVLFVSLVPPKGYAPEAFEKVDDTTYRDRDGSIYRVSTSTGDLMLFKDVRPPAAPPKREDLEAELERARTEPGTLPDESEWELVDHAIREMGKTHFIMGFTGDLAFPSFGNDDEAQLMNLALYPEECALITKIHGTRLVRGLGIFKGRAIDGIMPCGDLGSSTGLLANPRWYREHVWPWHKAYCDKAHAMGFKVLKHCCGRTQEVITDLVAAGYDAYEAIQATAGMDIGELKKQVGKQMTLWGGILHEHLILGTPGDIRRDARHAFLGAAKGGGFIMGSSHSLAVGAKRENLLEMKRVRDLWGVYPIREKNFV